MKGKGKGKSGKRASGKGISAYTMSLSDEDYEEIYFGGRGKGKGKGKEKGTRSTGKGGGRKLTPRGRDGRIMKCYIPNCGSETHLARNCPLKGRGKGQPSFTAITTTAHTNVYVDNVEDIYMITCEEEESDEDMQCVPCLDSNGGQPAMNLCCEHEHIFMMDATDQPPLANNPNVQPPTDAMPNPTAAPNTYGPQQPMTTPANTSATTPAADPAWTPGLTADDLTARFRLLTNLRAGAQ